MKKSIAIDFDGVIHSYENGWQDGSIYGKELPCVFECIQELMKTHTVFVFSARKPRQIKQWIRNRTMESGWYDNGGMEAPMSEHDWPKYGFTVQIIPFWKKFWNKENVLGITGRKLVADIYIDDRGLKFEGDWLQTMDQLKSFKTWQYKEPVIDYKDHDFEQSELHDMFMSGKIDQEQYGKMIRL